MAERQTINIKGLVQEKALRVIRTLRLLDPSCFVNRECHLAAECYACLTHHCKRHAHAAITVGLSTRLAAEVRHWGCCGIRGIGSEGLHLGQQAKADERRCTNSIHRLMRILPVRRHGSKELLSLSKW